MSAPLDFFSGAPVAQELCATGEFALKVKPAAQARATAPLPVAQAQQAGFYQHRANPRQRHIRRSAAFSNHQHMEATMAELRFLVIEYLPQLMDGYDPSPVRIDGHYLDKTDAIEIAALWSQEPMHQESRIVVAEIQWTEKLPATWEAGE